VSYMDSLFAIGAGLTLRVVVDFVSDHNVKIGGTLVGIWEGVVLYHFLGKMPRSFDPYVAYGFRLFVDFLFTESLAKMTIVMLWTGLGVLLSDIAPSLWNDSGLRRLYRRTWVRLPGLPLVPKVAIPTRRTVQFWDSPPPSSAASDITNPTTILPVLPPTSRLRHRSPTPPPRPSVIPRKSLPGAFPGFGSEAGTDVSASRLTTTDDDGMSDSDTAMPDQYSRMPEILPDDGPLPAGIGSTLLDADSTTASQESTPKRSSVALFTTNDEPFHIVEHDEVQPAIDDVPNIPDDPTASSAYLPIPPMPIAHVPSFPNFEVAPIPIPPMPNATVPQSDGPPVYLDKPPAVPEKDVSTAGIPLPVSDDKTLPPPADEWVQVQGGDASNRKSFADSEMSPPETVLTGGRNSLISLADLLRQQAEAEDKIRAELADELKKLKEKGDVKGAFLLTPQIDEAENRAKRLHGRAERRYFHGMLYIYLFSQMPVEFCVVFNKQSPPATIDVQKLKVPEAIRQTENAIRDVLADGGKELRVVTDGTVLNSTHLAIIRAMQEWVSMPFRPTVYILIISFLDTRYMLNRISLILQS
jgi:hypothetical protein